MTLELTARTVPGDTLVRLAERIAAGLAVEAARHDREGTFPFEAVEALRSDRYYAAATPGELGGLGVESVHDLVVASSRLARGDASVAIGVNMHLTVTAAVAHHRRLALARGEGRRAAAFGGWLAELASGGAVLTAAVSEPGQDLTRPATRAVRTEIGWTVTGRKIFATGSPAATVLYTAVTAVGHGPERYAYARIPADAPGVVVHGDWDAMGMRASGSHTITFDGVALPPEAVRGGFAPGSAVSYMADNLTAGLFHASASLGIAESADAHVRTRLAGADPGAHGWTQVAASQVDLAAARATLARAALLVDEHRTAHPAAEGTDEEILALFVEAQAAKAFVTEACGRVVDRALGLSGGSGYLNGSLLARAYRDVRAGAFMHPLGSNRAYELLGRVALGHGPELH